MTIATGRRKVQMTGGTTDRTGPFLVGCWSSRHEARAIPTGCGGQGAAGIAETPNISPADPTYWPDGLDGPVSLAFWAAFALASAALRTSSAVFWASSASRLALATW